MRRRRLDVERDAVALLDRADGRLLAAPGERPDDREAARDPRDLRGERTPRPSASSVDSSSGHRRLTSSSPGRCSGSSVVDFASASSRAIGGFVSARRPSQAPIIAAASHQPAMNSTSVGLASALAASDRHGGERRRRAGAQQHRRRAGSRRSASRGGYPASAEQELADAARAVDEQVGRRLELRRRLVGAHADADGRAELARRHELAQGGERVEVGAVVADVERGVEVAPASRRRTPRPLSIATGGRTSSTLRPQCVARPAASARSATSRTAASAASSSGAPRQWKAAIASLSSARTRRRCSAGVQASRAKARTRPPRRRPRGRSRPPCRRPPAARRRGCRRR